MKKQLAAFAALGALLIAPATAQDAGQIASVQAGQSCAGCNLFQANLAYRDISNLNLRGSRLRQANLSLTTMDGTNFSGADLSVANLFGGRFTAASFRNANLSQAVLVGAYFGSADFSGATLTGVNLSGADLTTAHNLTQTQLSGACGDEYTRLPRGLQIRACR